MPQNDLYGPDLFGRQPAKKKVQPAHSTRPTHPAQPATAHKPTVHTAKVVKKPAKTPSHTSAGQAHVTTRKPQPTATTASAAIVWPMVPKNRIQPLHIPAGAPTTPGPPVAQSAQVVWPTASTNRIQPIRTATTQPRPSVQPRPDQPVAPNVPSYQPDPTPDVNPTVYPSSPDDPTQPGGYSPAVVPGGDDSGGNTDNLLPTDQTNPDQADPSSGPASTLEPPTPEIVLGGLLLIGLLYLFNK